MAAPSDGDDFRFATSLPDTHDDGILVTARFRATRPRAKNRAMHLHANENRSECPIASINLARIVRTSRVFDREMRAHARERMLQRDDWSRCPGEGLYRQARLRAQVAPSRVSGKGAGRRRVVVSQNVGRARTSVHIVSRLRSFATSRLAYDDNRLISRHRACSARRYYRFAATIARGAGKFGKLHGATRTLVQCR